MINQGRAGIPFEGSIFFDDAILEYVDEGFQTEVNGETFHGPGVVVREWVLRGCAVCPYGADGSTNSSFAESSAVKFSWRGKAMPRKAKSADKLTAETDETVVDQVATESNDLDRPKKSRPNLRNRPNRKHRKKSRKGVSYLPVRIRPNWVRTVRNFGAICSVFGDADGAKFFADGFGLSSCARQVHRQVKRGPGRRDSKSGRS